MYFSSLVKQELSRILPQNISEQRGELLAFIMMKGSIKQQNKVLALILENPVMIKVVYFLFKKVFDYEVIIETIKKRNKKKFYLVTVADPSKIKNIMEQFNLKVNLQGKLIYRYPNIFAEDKFYSDQFFTKAFIRGVFLAEGFINDPERMYHLELSCSSKHEAKLICDILQVASFTAKISFWQKKWAVYMKKSEQIFEFLRFVGVQRALLKFQDIIARKDILNTVNRLVNCETANIDKTVLSASRQLFYIDVLKQHIGLENLSRGLVEVIEARLDNPYASIQELANIIGGNISKSGIFHRLKKIEQLVEYYLAEEKT
jgi:cell division protein WhiA